MQKFIATQHWFEGYGGVPYIGVPRLLVLKPSINNRGPENQTKSNHIKWKFRTCTGPRASRGSCSAEYPFKRGLKARDRRRTCPERACEFQLIISSERLPTRCRSARQGTDGWIDVGAGWVGRTAVKSRKVEDRTFARRVLPFQFRPPPTHSQDLVTPPPKHLQQR